MDKIVLTERLKEFLTMIGVRTSLYVEGRQFENGD